MDGPPAGSKFVVQNQEIKKSQNGLKFYISSDVPHTHNNPGSIDDAHMFTYEIISISENRHPCECVHGDTTMGNAAHISFLLPGNTYHNYKVYCTLKVT